jgi:putative transcriptional regulator
MGLIVNKRMDEVTFEELLEQLEIERPTRCAMCRSATAVRWSCAAGFVLHSADYARAGRKGSRSTTASR